MVMVGAGAVFLVFEADVLVGQDGGILVVAFIVVFVVMVVMTVFAGILGF